MEFDVLSIFDIFIERVDILIFIILLIYSKFVFQNMKDINQYPIALKAFFETSNLIILFLCGIFTLKLFYSVFEFEPVLPLISFLYVSLFWIGISLYLSKLYDCWLEKKYLHVESIHFSETDNKGKRTFLLLCAYLIRTLLILLSAISIAHHLGYGLTGLLVIKGALIVIISFAAENLIKNCIYGLVIRMEQPFKEGDRIKTMLYGKSIWGVIKKINLRYVEFVCTNKSIIYIPSSYIHKMTLYSLEGENKKGMEIHVRFQYEDIDKIDVFEKQICSYLSKSKDVGEGNYIFSIKELGQNGCLVGIRFFTSIDYFAMREQILFEVIDIFTINNIRFSIPVEVHHRK